MPDKILGYVKDGDGVLCPIASLYDGEGNEISTTYAKKSEVSIPAITLDKDSEGYLIIVDNKIN